MLKGAPTSLRYKSPRGCAKSLHEAAAYDRKGRLRALFDALDLGQRCASGFLRTSRFERAVRQLHDLASPVACEGAEIQPVNLLDYMFEFMGQQLDVISTERNLDRDNE